MFVAVLAFRIDPGNHNSNFFSELPTFFDFRDLSKNETILSNPAGALMETGWFSEFWTYRGGSARTELRDRKIFKLTLCEKVPSLPHPALRVSDSSLPETFCSLETSR